MKISLILKEVLIEKLICVTNLRNHILTGASLFLKDIKHYLMLLYVSFGKLVVNIPADTEGKFPLRWPFPMLYFLQSGDNLFLEVSTLATH